MISLKLIPLILVLLIVIYLAALSFNTRQHVLKAHNERVLTACPAKPNCVSSQATDAQHQIDPLPLIDNNPEKSWKKLMAVIRQSGGEILVDDGKYCHAVFTSLLFRFKDDFEAILNASDISIRSASRAGTSDMGANRKRVERIRELYQ